MSAFLSGFLIKTLASLDDTVTKVPILLGMTKTRKGKISFCIGNLIALALIVGIAEFISEWTEGISWFPWFLAGFILLLATGIAFDIPTAKRFQFSKKLLKKTSGNIQRLWMLLFMGFTVSFITLIDDALVFVPLFQSGSQQTIAAITGIFVSTIIQLIIVMISAEAIEKIPYKKWISVGGLVIYAILIASGIL